MKKTIRAAFVAALLSSTAAVVAMSPAPAMAQAAAPAPKPTPAINNKLADASKQANAGKYPEALALVKEAQAIPNPNEFDKYQINKITGYVSVKMENYDAAEVAYDAMVRSPAIPAADRQNVLDAAASMALNGKHYDKVVEYVGMAEAAGIKDDKLYKAAAQAAYLKGDPATAESLAVKSLAITDPTGVAPDKILLDVLVGAQMDQKKDAAAQATLERIAFTFGDKKDWGVAISQAIGIAAPTATDQDYAVIHLGRLMYAADGITQPQDYKLFGESANRRGLLGDVQQAQENGASGMAGVPANLAAKVTTDKASLAKVDAEAAKAKDGTAYVANADSYYGYGNFAKAEEDARAGLAKGGLRASDQVEANMILGETLVQQGHYSDAIPIFNAINSNAAINKAAKMWAGYASQKLKAANAAATAPVAGAPAR